MDCRSKPHQHGTGFSDPMPAARALLCAVVLASCHPAEARHVPKRLPTGAIRASGVLVGPARFFAVPDGTRTSFSAEDPDGTRRLISAGVRLLLHADGRIERAEQTFAAGDSIKAIDLPARFGPGYLFLSNKGGTTSVWRSATWTGALDPFASLTFDAARIIPGLDRLYLDARRSQALVALDPRTGAAIDVGPLPPAPGYSEMVFADEWFGAVEVPLRGVLVTFDAGSSWHPLGVNRTAELGLDGDRIVVSSADGILAVDASGQVERQDGEAGADDDGTA
jgi:hypothetical protein